MLGELGNLGLWSDAMAEVQVWLRPFATTCFGWQDYGSTGDIHTPALHGYQNKTKIQCDEIIRVSITI